LQVFRHVMITLYLFQLVMIALLIVKRFVWVALLAIPILVTGIVHRIGAGLLQRSWDVVSMRAAYELDAADAAAQQKSQQQQHQQLGASQHSGQRSSSCQAEEAAEAGREGHRAWDGNQVFNSESGSSSSSSRSATAVEGSVRVGSSAGAGASQQGSVAMAWDELYRPPGQRLLLVGPKIEVDLSQQVAAMKQRLAAHNAAVQGHQKRSAV
jgi:hypothetical protein